MKNEEKHSVQIIDNYYLRPQRDGKYFPTLAKEVLEQDKYSSSSWYELSDEAFNEWILCLEMWKAENNEDWQKVKEIKSKQRDLYERLEWVL